MIEKKKKFSKKEIVLKMKLKNFKIESKIFHKNSMKALKKKKMMFLKIWNYKMKMKIRLITYVEN